MNFSHHLTVTSLTRTLGACGLALLLGACTLTPRGAQNSYQGTTGKLELERIEGNRSLAASLLIQDPIEKLVDGRQVAQFKLQNTRSSAKRFAWAVDWFDEDGFRITDVARVFEPVSLGGNGSTYITITSPRAGKKMSWKLIVTDPDEVH